MTNDLRTLYGVAAFSWLTEKDTKFNPEGIYHVDLKVKKEDADPEVTIINQAISKKIAEEHKKGSIKTTAPVKRAPLAFEKQEDGSYIFKIKSKFKPKLWDKSRKELGPDTFVWKGTSMWVQYKLNPYNQNIGLGCTLYLQNVQIDNLVQGSSQNGSCPFPKREGSALPGPEAKAVY